MSEPVFNEAYASAYDDLYREKNYQGECDTLEALFQQYSSRPIRRILDLGCGTGAHALSLAERGYEVTGVDRSEHMLELARRKAHSADLSTRPIFHSGDIRTIDLKQTFDAVIMMFAVLGYQVENDDVAAALGTVREHLSAEGVFVFDVWHGPAILVQRPGDRVRVETREDTTIIRTASGSLDTNAHVCSVKYGIWRLNHDRVIGRDQETHRMRFFFPKELEHMLGTAGLRLRTLRAFPETDRDPDETTWNVVGAANRT